jgi:hypothetical protein
LLESEKLELVEEPSVPTVVNSSDALLVDGIDVPAAAANGLSAETINPNTVDLRSTFNISPLVLVGIAGTIRFRGGTVRTVQQSRMGTDTSPRGNKGWHFRVTFIRLLPV